MSRGKGATLYYRRGISVDSNEDATVSAMKPIRLLALLGATALCACAGDTTTQPVTAAPADLSQLMGQMTFAPYTAAAASVAGVTVPGITNQAPAACPYSTVSQIFVCTPLTTNGLTIDESFALYDASGTVQSGFNPVSTASIWTNTTVDGSESTAAGVVNIKAQQTLTLSGLLTTTHTLNGTSTTLLTGSLTVDDVTQPVTSTLTQTIANVVVPNAIVSGGSYPLSGSVTMDGSTTLGTGLPPAVIHSVITFNGTSKATMTLVVAGLTEHCILDLSGSTAPVCG
jgi:hypothetical protein